MNKRNKDIIDYFWEFVDKLNFYKIPNKISLVNMGNIQMPSVDSSFSNIPNLERLGDNSNIRRFL